MSGDWPRTSIANVLSLNRSGFWGEGSPKGDSTLLVRVVRNGDISVEGTLRGSADRFFTPKEARVSQLVVGDIALTTSGDVGKAWLVDQAGDLHASNFVRILRPDRGKVLPAFLRYALETRPVIDALRSNTAGTTIANLQKNFYDAAQFALPSLIEQRRILAGLDAAFGAVDTARANTERKLSDANEILRTLVTAIFKADDGTWQKRSLGSLVSLFVDSAHRTPRYQKEGVPALRPRDVVNGALDLSRSARVSDEEYAIQSKRHEPEPGDIVYSRELSYGWAAILPKTPRVCLSQGMCLFRASSEVDSAFLLSVLNGPIGREQAQRAAVGTAHPHINLSEIKAYLIPLPPIEAQRAIANRIDDARAQTQRLVTLCQRKLSALDELRQSLLHQAFTPPALT